jgi:hypothetical protein
MNTSPASTTPCLFCQSPIPIPHTGRLPKYCSEAHKKAHQRASKATLQAIQSKESTPSTPPPNTTPLSSNPLLINGIDYSNPWKSLPPHIAAYMPIQEPADLQRLRDLEHRIHKATPKDAHCKF